MFCFLAYKTFALWHSTCQKVWGCGRQWHPWGVISRSVGAPNYLTSPDWLRKGLFQGLSGRYRTLTHANWSPATAHFLYFAVIVVIICQWPVGWRQNKKMLRYMYAVHVTPRYSPCFIFFFFFSFHFFYFVGDGGGVCREWGGVMRRFCICLYSRGRSLYLFSRLAIVKGSEY